MSIGVLHHFIYLEVKFENKKDPIQIKWSVTHGYEGNLNRPKQHVELG